MKNPWLLSWWLLDLDPRKRGGQGVVLHVLHPLSARATVLGWGLMLRASWSLMRGGRAPWWHHPDEVAVAFGAMMDSVSPW